jgi:hypothetical protein
MIKKILVCLLFHKHTRYERSMKCRKCGLYYRAGAASPAWRKYNAPAN